MEKENLLNQIKDILNSQGVSGLKYVFLMQAAQESTEEELTKLLEGLKSEAGK